MKHEKHELFDVLSSIEDKSTDENTTLYQESVPETSAEQEQDFFIQDDSHLFFQEEEIVEDTEEAEVCVKQETNTEQKENTRPAYISQGIFLIKYLITSGLIFVVLVFTTNYSAYYNIIMSTVFQKEFAQKSEKLISSVEASSISQEKEVEEPTISLESAPIEPQEREFNSIDTLASKARRAEVDLDITITPYENRVVIPKIWKNIPLIDIQQENISGLGELNDIFMEELENGVIRYPGSGLPGEVGNMFVFGHSSNFPWMEWDYNDVFALLDKVVFDDEVIVYYGQKKYTYKIRTKDIIKPGNVSVLKRNKGRSEITLMTCWPIGTTLNRMILIWELVEE